MVYTVTSGSLKGTEGVRWRCTTACRVCLTTGEVLVANDTETDTRVDRQACRRVRARSMICVPLRHRTGRRGTQGDVDLPQAFGGG